MTYQLVCMVCLMSLFFFKQKTAYEMRISDWSSDVCSSDLHFVTGKGGTGKSTIAAALALALAAGGRKVLLVEVEGRQGIAQLFDVPQIGRASCRERVCQYV